MNRAVLRHFPKGRLAQLASRDGGLSRDEAVAAAARNVEALRGESEHELGETVTALEALLAGVRRGTLTDAALAQLRSDADRIVSLSGMYGLSSLNQAARSLCDLIAELEANDVRDASGAVVHVRALRLFAPGSVPMAADAEARMLDELAKLVQHYIRQVHAAE